MSHRATIWAATLLAAIAAPSVAQAGSITRSFNNGIVDFMAIFEFGDAVQPVVINQNDPINIAGVFEFGDTGPVDSTIIQTGTRNVADVFQVGDTTNSIIGQFGPSNTAHVTQIGNVTNSLIAQFEDMNAGFAGQYGRNSAPPGLKGGGSHQR